MSILIKGIDMPIDCWNCVCIDKEFGKCQATDKTIYGDIPKWCPLVEVPAPHGRLVDADNTIKKMEVLPIIAEHAKFIIEHSETVIEAEG